MDELIKEDFEQEGFTITESESRLIGKKPIKLEVLEDGKWCSFMLYIYYRKKLKSLSLVRWNIHDPDKRITLEDIDNIYHTKLYFGRVRNREHLKQILEDVLYYE